jgi:hypothetical protein
MANTFKLRFSKGPNVVLKSYNFAKHYNQIIAPYYSNNNSYFVKGTESNVDERSNYSSQDIVTQFDTKGQVYCVKLFSYTENDISTDYLAVGGD